MHTAPESRSLSGRRVDPKERSSIVDRFFVIDQHSYDLAPNFRRDFVEHFHRFDDAHCRVRLDVVSHFDKWLGVGIGTAVKRTNHGAFNFHDGAGVSAASWAGRRRRCA